VSAERREWLERLAAACERVLEDYAGDRSDPGYAVVREDVERLLAKIRGELDAPDG
jgi:hypothetical protein